MEPQLHCGLRLVASPFPGRDAIDVWGEVALTVESDHGREPLLVWQWDLDQLAEWFTENVRALCDGKLEIAGERPLPGESLGEAIERFRRRVFEEGQQEAIDRWVDSIHKYRDAHVLRFGMRGARIPDIIVGCHGGAGEISLTAWQSEQMNYEENPLPSGAFTRLGRWSYQFDMHAFLIELHDGLAQVLSEWLSRNRDPVARQRVEALRQRLPGLPCLECCGETG